MSMNGIKYQCYFVVFMLILTFKLTGQDLEEIGKSKPIALSGRISLGFSTYHVQGIDARRSPFSWRISGNPTVSIYGIDVPLRLAVGDQRYSFDHPFTRYGMSPYYKWVKVHLGWSNMRFSPYTLGGRSFFGAGMELTPGKFKFASFYGKLEDIYARVDTLVYGAERIQTFERNAYGVQLGVGSRNNYVRLSSVRAKDNIKSVASPQELSEMGLQPQDNLVLGLSMGFRFFKRMRLKIETAASVLTDDQSAENFTDLSNNLESLLSFFEPNRRTYISYAGDATLSYSFRKLSVLALYKRVEPRFQTLTTRYFNQDYENYRLQVNSSIGKKITIQLGGGLQRDNLYSLRKFTTTRIIGNLNLTYRPNKSWSFGGRYANFNRDMSEDVAAVNDTLRRVNVNQQSGINIRYQSPKKESKFGIHFNAFRNTIRDLSPGENNIGDIESLNLSLGSTFGLLDSKLVFSPTINYTAYSFGPVFQERYGGGMGISWRLDKKLSWSLRSLYNLNDINYRNNGFVLRNSVNASWRIHERQSLQMRLSAIKRTSTTRPSFTEFRTSVGYGYKF